MRYRADTPRVSVLAERRYQLSNSEGAEALSPDWPEGTTASSAPERFFRQPKPFVLRVGEGYRRQEGADSSQTLLHTRLKW